MSSSHFRSWLVRNGYWVRSGEQPSAAPGLTHVFLDGGRAAVPLFARGEGSGLIQAYARDVRERREVHAVERTLAGGTYRMFADIDLSLGAEKHDDVQHDVQHDEDEGEDGEDEEDEKQRIGFRDKDAALLRVVRSILRHAPQALRRGVSLESPIVLCVRREAPGGTATATSKAKAGAHLIWGDRHRVDDATAVALHADWVRRLREHGLQAAADALDGAVYRSNGLRMPWSLKGGAAAKSGAAQSWYVPTHVALFSDAGGCAPKGRPRLQALCPEAVQASLESWVWRCSLAPCAAGEAGADERPYCLAPTVVAPPQPPSFSTNAAKGSGNGKGKAEAQAQGAGNRRSLLALSEAEAANFRAALPEPYSGARLRTDAARLVGDQEGAEKGGSGGNGGGNHKTGRGVIVVPCDSRHCLIAGREHRSNHVYFVLHADAARTVTQRCHSARCQDAPAAVLKGVRHGLALSRFQLPKLTTEKDAKAKDEATKKKDAAVANKAPKATTEKKKTKNANKHTAPVLPRSANAAVLLLLEKRLQRQREREEQRLATATATATTTAGAVTGLTYSRPQRYSGTG